MKEDPQVFWKLCICVLMLNYEPETLPTFHKWFWVITTAYLVLCWVLYCLHFYLKKDDEK